MRWAGSAPRGIVTAEHPNWPRLFSAATTKTVQRGYWNLKTGIGIKSKRILNL